MSTETIGSLVPTTELEAINAMLAVNGTSPIENLTDPVRADVEVALNMIRSTSRGIQSRGWHFNTVRAVTIARATNQFPVPTNALRVRKTVIEAQRTWDVSHRSGFLWNNLTNTNTFTSSDYANGIQLDIVYCLDFTALPESARQYVFISAGRRYQEQSFGNADLSTFTKADEQQALLNLVDAEGLIEYVDEGKAAKDQLRANQVWDEVSAQVQQIGWHFNTRKQIALTPEPTGPSPAVGTITLPTGTLRAQKSIITSQYAINAAHRGTVMYDVQNDTAVWVPADLPDGVLKVDIVMLIARADLPPIAKKYIDIKAARQLQPKNKQPGAKGDVTGYTERDEFTAFRDLQDAEGLIEDYSLRNDANVANTMYGRYPLYGSGAYDPTINR